MTDERLADDLRALITKEGAAPSLSGEASARIAERLSATLGLPALPTPPSGAGVDAVLSGASSHAPGAAAVGSGWTVAKLAPIAIAFVLGGASGAAITARVMERAPVRSAPVQGAQPGAEPAPASVVAAEPIAIAPAPVAPGLEPPAPTTATAARKAGATADDDLETDRDLRAERELIALARRALARGHAEDALTALERHDRRFARGRLAEERDSLRVPALVMLGRSSEAVRRAAAFWARYPNSLFAPVVESALQSATPEANP